ncbi:MAG: glycosyltransferase family 4 protein [Candidatus Eisenbacteria bacterium]|uniref:Glycosyltransferase family 4 protein n=1 Tax=Eiseniibacteriota bacterium TaxID=2212470 RepID=A0A538T6P9_UNCEI|nr:MAG: glycosyltransferase family 4 protein [Candidatus Eisenbacteria bacterium]TMQ59307.1 MAG: glycosyltransferase family 4 protein [Candidatus Eisenbacteria bacterium]
MRVALFGAYDASYPRTRVLREGLESRGAEVLSIQAPPDSPPLLRETRLLLSWIRSARKVDALLVPSFGHRDIPLAGLLGRAADSPVLFDPLVSRWDTQVGDLGRLPAGSLSARRVRASDRLSLSLADMVLCDTWEHGDFYSNEFGVARRKLCRVPVGADRFAFELGERRAAREHAGPLDVVYLGGYLPLHGLPAVVDAAAELETKYGERFATFTLIGGGMFFPRVERDVAARGLRSVRLVPRMPYEEAITRLARADVGLGIFGTSAKSGRVVPHKVFQSMALGIPTVTRRSAAITEFFRDEEHLALVPPGDGPALARAIESLARDPDRREKMGASGRSAARAQASPARIGDLLVEAIQRSRDATAPGARR